MSVYMTTTFVNHIVFNVRLRSSRIQVFVFIHLYFGELCHLVLLFFKITVKINKIEAREMIHSLTALFTHSDNQVSVPRKHMAAHCQLYLVSRDTTAFSSLYGYETCMWYTKCLYT